jgi:hypothetical protein
MMAIPEAMLINKMIITSAEGHSASARAQRPDQTRPALTKRNLQPRATLASALRKLPASTNAA